VVVTALPVTYSIATALAADTDIEVVNVPEGGRRMSQLPDLFVQRGDRYRDVLQTATAVVTIGKLWPDDPLYTAARSANVRVVDIDATKPWSTTLEGVSVAFEPLSNVPWATAPGSGASRRPSAYFWLSPANGARSAEIVARDLARLVPEDAPRIEQNLDAYRDTLLALQREYESKLAALSELTVAALAPEFVYLTNEFGIYVDGYFLKQDVDWTEEDLRAFEGYLRDDGIGVVIHKWEPEEPIRAAIDAAGAKLVVLDPIDLGVVEGERLLARGYEQLLRSNLESLYSALAVTNE
jgi:ABC-type Zn uptake system ZnuABC Zn-binding protein ZnuA